MTSTIAITSNKHLPFRTQPTPVLIPVGNEEIGILEVERKYGITPNELNYINAKKQEYKLPDLQYEAASIAEKIAKESEGKINLVDAFNGLTTGRIGELSGYLKEFLDLQKSFDATQEKIDKIQVTALIKYRLVPEWELEDTEAQISPGLLAELLAFYNKEVSGWTPEEIKPLTEDDIKSNPITFESGEDE